MLGMLGQPLIINLAPTGAVADRSKNPNVPIDVRAIHEAVATSAGLGASLCHLHIRNKEGAPSCDPALFAELFSRLRSDPVTRDLVLCASTSGRHGQTLEQRAAVLDLPVGIRPDMGSLTLGSLNFPTGPSLNAPDTIRYLADRMNASGVKPELEIFDLGMVEFARTLIDEGRLTPPYYFNIILGNVGSLACDLQTLAFVIGALPQPALVSVGGVGRAQSLANAFGLVAGTGVRVGLEDNLWQERGDRVPASNPAMVELIAERARVLGRRVATPSETRKMLDLVR